MNKRILDCNPYIYMIAASKHQTAAGGHSNQLPPLDKFNVVSVSLDTAQHCLAQMEKRSK